MLLILSLLVVTMMGASVSEPQFYYPQPYPYYFRRPAAFPYYNPSRLYRPHPYYVPYFKSASPEELPEEEPQQNPAEAETFNIPAPTNGAFGTTLSIQSSNSFAPPEYFNFTKEFLDAAFRSYQQPLFLNHARHGQLNHGNPNNQPHYQYHPYDPVWPYYY